MRNGVAAVGICSWDRLLVTESYPGPGEYAIVCQQIEQAGGTTGNTCAALGGLEVDVLLASYVGDDAEGERLLGSFTDAGCDITHVRRKAGQATDSAYIVVSGSGRRTDRTIYWLRGAKPVMGDVLPVDDLLAYRWVLIDVDDSRLRSFLLDLPAHRSPRTRLIGTLTFLVEMDPFDGWSQALRHDVMVGNQRELLFLTQSTSLEQAITTVQHDLRFNACQVAFVSRGPAGSIAIRPNEIIEASAYPVDVIDTTGAGDAFAAGCIWGLLDSRDDRGILTRGNAVGGLVCRALGARAALPDTVEVERLMNQ